MQHGYCTVHSKCSNCMYGLFPHASLAVKTANYAMQTRNYCVAASPAALPSVANVNMGTSATSCLLAYIDFRLNIQVACRER